MASVSGVSGSNISSIYGNRNIISGLASGLDTEALISNSVKGYQLKISGLQQQQTKLNWKQEAYRSISDLLVQLSQKYTSYTSSTNLLSASFFNNATITTANGANADKVSATGKTSSSVAINGVAQLATASRYYVDGGGVLGSVTANSDGTRTIMSGEAIGFADNTDVSNVSGTLSIAYGGNTVSLSFAGDEVYQTEDEFLQAIRDKLDEQNITFTSGNSMKASDAIAVTLADGKITFSDKTSGNNSVYLSGATGKLATTFGGSQFTPANNINALDLNGKSLTATSTVIEQVAGQTMSFSLDGTVKKITLPTAEELQAYIQKSGDSAMTQEKAFTEMLQDKLNKAYGTGKVTVENGTTEAGKLQLGFTVGNGSNLTINSTANAALGLSATESTSLNTGKTLGDLLGSDLGLTGGTLLRATGTVTRQTDGTYKDSEGNRCNADGERLGKDGNPLYSFDLEINGTKIGSYTRDTALESVMLAINNNAEAGVNLSYSSTTNQFVFTSTETGSGHAIEIGSGLGEAIFGSFNAANYTEGQDAIVNMTVNGSNLTVARSSNIFSVDGLTVTLNDTFNSANGVFDFAVGGDNNTVDTSAINGAVTFTTKADADKIVDGVKSMVDDINTILKNLREAFNTLPATKSDNSKYAPLTESDMESMTESAIKNYEEKAKQGILFGDRDLSSLYNKLISAFTPGNTDGVALRSMGITTTYSSGLTQIEVDETRLRDALSTNPDAVRDAFTKVSGEGSATNGVMANLKSTLNTYASVEGAAKGILISKAGSKYSALSLLQNSLKSQIDDLDKQVLKWQTKMASKVDYYTRQYTQLEVLISRMNEQSSSLASLTSNNGTSY